MTTRAKYATSSVASIIIVTLLGGYSLFSLPLEFEIQCTLVVVLLITFVACLFFWQPSQVGEEKLVFWSLFTLFGVAWTFIGFCIGSAIYRVPYSEVLRLDSDALNSMGYLGPLAIGPLVFLVGVVTLLRRAVFRLIDGIFT
jgi:hypothetical protein